MSGPPATFGLTTRLRGQRRGARADVDLAHRLAFPSVVGSAIHQHLAFVHHCHSIGKSEHAIDVVLD